MKLTDTLPQLDGTVETANARLEAWVSLADDELLSSELHEVEANLEESQTIIRSLGSTEECDNDSCTRSGDVEYLGDEVSKALTTVRDLLSEVG